MPARRGCVHSKTGFGPCVLPRECGQRQTINQGAAQLPGVDTFMYNLQPFVSTWSCGLQQVADADTKPDLCAKIAAVADKFAPSKRWHIDTLVSMLAFAGNNVKRVAMSQTLFLISHATEDHAAVTHKLFAMAQASATPSQEAQQALLQIAVWVIGEYGELLLKSPPMSAPAADELSPPFGEVRTEHDVSLCEHISGRAGSLTSTRFLCRSCAY
jgi:hypothetical protein